MANTLTEPAESATASRDESGLRATSVTATPSASLATTCSSAPWTMCTCPRPPSEPATTSRPSRRSIPPVPRALSPPTRFPSSTSMRSTGPAAQRVATRPPEGSATTWRRLCSLVHSVVGTGPGFSRVATSARRVLGDGSRAWASTASSRPSDQSERLALAAAADSAAAPAAARSASCSARARAAPRWSIATHPTPIASTSAAASIHRCRRRRRAVRASAWRAAADRRRSSSRSPWPAVTNSRARDESSSSPRRGSA